ncbi:hypothetical protein, partial [Acidovorax delafieldii]|uniref:hypothetical protein n=1 Tax=Acidovorax delafieldii TaxID=47920 RepID=UPI001E2E6C3B
WGSFAWKSTEDLLAGLLGQRIQAQVVLIHGATVLDAWRCGRSAGEVLQTFLGTLGLLLGFGVLQP